MFLLLQGWGPEDLQFGRCVAVAKKPNRSDLQVLVSALGVMINQPLRVVASTQHIVGPHPVVIQRT